MPTVALAASVTDTTWAEKAAGRVRATARPAVGGAGAVPTAEAGGHRCRSRAVDDHRQTGQAGGPVRPPAVRP